MYEGSVDFPIRHVVDEDGNAIERGDEETRFRAGRAGDMYMVPFQCPLCQFRNLKGRDPVRLSASDQELLDYITRAILDSLWARESSTVRGNLSGVKMALQSMQRFGLGQALPPIGPFPLRDSMGMGQAIIMLDRSLSKGKYERTIQWNTTRKIASAMNNFGQASVDGLKDSIGSYENHKLWISSVVGHTFFFSRFKEGMHRRVGEVVRPDEPITIDLLSKVLSALETDWVTEKGLPSPRAKELRRLAITGAWYTVGFCASLRGEEMLLLEMSGTRNSSTNLSLNGSDMSGHFVVSISSPVKNSRVTGGRISIPIAANCPSDLRAGLWMTRYLQCDQRTTGPLFKMRFQVPKLVEFEDVFFSPLEKVRIDFPELIPETISTREDFGILRSLRRGSNAHALNCGIDKDVIHAINRWRSAMSGSGESRLIQDRYARLDAIRPTMLKYSSNL